MASPVKLYVYDVTRGMASQMAPMLIGRPLDGVWHTGIVAYGNEYFYGGGGISSCLPSGTILGHPTQVVDLGETEIPQDMFYEYLIELSTSRFSENSYHLLDHNCNTFSDEVAQFLTGRKIPEHITNLPAEILATPFGQMIRPFIDSMMMEVAANSTMRIGPGSAPLPVTCSQGLTTTTTAASHDEVPSSSSTETAPSQNPTVVEAAPKPDSSSDSGKAPPAKEHDFELD